MSIHVSTVLGDQMRAIRLVQRTEVELRRMPNLRRKLLTEIQKAGAE